MPPAPAPNWNDLIATDPSGESLGRVEDVYVEPSTGRPTFARLRSSSLLGLRHREVLVPAHRAEERAGTLVLPYAAERVREAPALKGHDADAPGSPPAREHLRETLAFFEGDEHQLLGDEDVASTVLHEERLHVGRRVRDFERVRFRKVIVEEEVTVTVTLRREELEVVREELPVDPDAIVTSREEALADAAEYALPPDIVLYAEEPVVTAQVVPRERVRVSRHVVTERATIVEPLGHEEVRLETDPVR